jgi:hypothetical protein
MTLQQYNMYQMHQQQQQMMGYYNPDFPAIIPPAQLDNSNTADVANDRLPSHSQNLSNSSIPIASQVSSTDNTLSAYNDLSLDSQEYNPAQPHLWTSKSFNQT